MKTLRHLFRYEVVRMANDSSDDLLRRIGERAGAVEYTMSVVPHGESDREILIRPERRWHLAYNSFRPEMTLRLEDGRIQIVCRLGKAQRAFLIGFFLLSLVLQVAVLVDRGVSAEAFLPLCVACFLFVLAFAGFRLTSKHVIAEVFPDGT